MDLLFKRYASPFSFMDGMIQSGRFCEFVESFIEAVYKEREEETSWQFWLHKVLDGTYAEFREGMKNTENNQNMTQASIETTLKTSMDILNNFNPAKGGE